MKKSTCKSIKDAPSCPRCQEIEKVTEDNWLTETIRYLHELKNRYTEQGMKKSRLELENL